MEIKDLSIGSTALTLFLLMSSIALIPLYLSQIAPFDSKRQKIIVLRETIIAFFILMSFIFFGRKILNSIGIAEYVIGIAGGFLLLIISLNMIFPKKSGDGTDGLPKHEPFIVPLAIPGMAGPGSIATVMVYAKIQGIFITSLALFLAWLPSVIILLAAQKIKDYLGDRGLQAVERLGGMIIILIGIQMISHGIVELVRVNF